jgi:transposase
LEEAVAKVAEAHPDKKIEIWAEDEARIGLIPTTRRIWSPRGKRPVASSRRRYQWKYVSGFVHPATGATEWIITETVNNGMMSEVLNNFAKETRAGKEKEIVLVVDGAGWHTSKKMKVPVGIHLVHLPAYSPELQPAERMWPLLREATANRVWKDLTELVEQIDQRCKQLQRIPEQIARRTRFHWWPADRSPHRQSI